MSRKARRRSFVDTVVVSVTSLFVLVSAITGTRRNRRRDHREAEEQSSVPDPAEATGGGALDRIADRFPWLRPVVAVQRRFGEVGGNQLAAAFTFIAFLSLFPLLLVAIAVLGFVSAGADTDIAERLTAQLGLTGQAAETLTEAVASAERSRRAASIVGVAGLLWSGLGVVGALQYTYNSVWQVNERGLKDKASGLAWLVGAALLFVAGAAVTTALRWLPGVLAPAGVLVGLGVSFALWLWTSKVLPNRQLAWRNLVPGAIVGAVGLEVLKVLGAYWVPRTVASSSALYGSLGVVFAVLAWLALFGRLVVYSAVTNVVAYERQEGTMEAVVAAPKVPGAAPVATRSGRLVTTR